MTLLAKPVVKNRCWVVEKDGEKYGSILANDYEVVLVHGGRRERFPNLKMLKDRYNIVLDLPNTNKASKPVHSDVYGYPCQGKAHNILWEVQKKLPIYTQDDNSKSFYCAGFYIVKLNNVWSEAFCPKLITVNRYPYEGPFKTQEQMQQALIEYQKENHGISV